MCRISNFEVLFCAQTRSEKSAQTPTGADCTDPCKAESACNGNSELVSDLGNSGHALWTLPVCQPFMSVLVSTQTASDEVSATEYAEEPTIYKEIRRREEVWTTEWELYCAPCDSEAVIDRLCQLASCRLTDASAPINMLHEGFCGGSGVQRMRWPGTSRISPLSICCEITASSEHAQKERRLVHRQFCLWYAGQRHRQQNRNWDRRPLQFSSSSIRRHQGTWF